MADENWNEMPPEEQKPVAIPKRAAKRGGKDKNVEISKGCIVNLVKQCIDPRTDGSRWCVWHNRHLQNMTYQVGQEGQEQKIEFTSNMKDDHIAAEEIVRFAPDHIPGAKFRRNPKINWAQWNERHGVKVSKAKIDEVEPLDKKQFTIWRCAKFRCKQEEAEDEWESALNSA